MNIQCQGLPANHFPLKPATTYWNLATDGNERNMVKSKGFPLLPYFSSTIDSITGKTVDKGILDTGDWQEATSFYRAMKLYIGLSRVRKADDILLTGLLSPALFANGDFPWPTKLIEHLRRQNKDIDKEEVTRVSAMDTKRFLLKDQHFYCRGCQTTHIAGDFFTMPMTPENKQAWFDALFDTIIKPGTARVCKKSVAQHTCTQCKQEKMRSSFTESAWRHRYTRNAVCMECQQTTLTSAVAQHTCTKCKQEKMRSSFTERDRKSVV